MPLNATQRNLKLNKRKGPVSLFKEQRRPLDIVNHLRLVRALVFVCMSAFVRSFFRMCGLVADLERAAPQSAGRISSVQVQ